MDTIFEMVVKETGRSIEITSLTVDVVIIGFLAGKIPLQLFSKAHIHCVY
jgi:hypothetical protein